MPISAPTPEEAARPYLWRFWFHLPPRGNYSIFDRSWYGRVLVERELVEHGVIVGKFWMSVSLDEQLARFKERDRDPLKRFKVDPEDWINRDSWSKYHLAVRDMLALTDTRHAPWFVVPADDKRHARLTVLRELCERVEVGLG